MTEKIPYWKSSGALQAFFPRTGEEGCRLCTDDSIRLSLDRAPPPMRDAPLAAKPVAAKGRRQNPEDIVDKTLNVIEAIATGVEQWRKFQKWMETTAPAQPKVLKTAASKTEMHREPFDIQDIPVTVRRLGMWHAAKIFEKWFEGDLNYSLTDEDALLEINHLGKPYPESMIDKKSIKIDWVLKYPRAKAARDELIKNSHLTSVRAEDTLKKILSRNTPDACLSPWSWCGEDIQKLHREFQFQKIGVDGTLTQKLSQFGKQLVTSRGLPDELTMILGSFSLYAAISRAVVFYDGERRVAEITHIYVYARDGFTFNDKKGEATQYLGHWNRQTLAIVPAKAALQLITNREWIDGPVYQDPLRANFDVLYPVKNSDFRTWQAKHKRGGDFIIYTDRQAIRLQQPITVILD